jgi:hypothetical protein
MLSIKLISATIEFCLIQPLPSLDNFLAISHGCLLRPERCATEERIPTIADESLHQKSGAKASLRFAACLREYFEE